MHIAVLAPPLRFFHLIFKRRQIVVAHRIHAMRDQKSYFENTKPYTELFEVRPSTDDKMTEPG